jgi:hypothetical protein
MLFFFLPLPAISLMTFLSRNVSKENKFMAFPSFPLPFFYEPRSFANGKKVAEENERVFNSKFLRLPPTPMFTGIRLG